MTSITSPMWIFLAGLLLAGGLHFAAARVQTHSISRNQEISNSLNEEAEGQEKGRIFVGDDITPQYLASLYKGQTEMQAQRLVDIYVGKWMKIRGPISNVMTPTGDIVAVHLKRDAFNEIAVALKFSKPWHERLALLRQGNIITAVGKIDYTEAGFVMLEDCELVDQPNSPIQSN